MARNPFQPTRDQYTEFSFGRGRFAPIEVDFQSPRASENFGVAQVADPDRQQQLLDLAASKRTNLNDPTVADMPSFQGTRAEHPDYHSLGNTERYGANPPLIRERGWPKYRRYIYTKLNIMEREW